jgi:3-carboxy-cis,cis-muconate cycloisomerase
VSGSLTSRTLARPSFEAAFEPPVFLAAMVAFESALASAQAEEGLIPVSSARAIAGACERVTFDVDALVAEAKGSATLVVPFVSTLRSAVSAVDPAAASHVHFGATTQDVLDTAMVLCLRPCLEEADRSLEGAVRALARHAQEHRSTRMLGRTLMQPAIAMSAGVKIARWAAALAADRERVAEAQALALVVQWGGPTGTQQGLGMKGIAARKHLARRLGLEDGPSWQAHRNAWLDLLDRLGLVVLTAGKIARDIALLMQPEVGEMRESPPQEGVGASSAMPHKRNPVACAHALASATRMPGLLSTLHSAGLGEHERALGGWQAELALVPEIASALGSSLDFLDIIASSLVVDAARMKANLDSYGAPGTTTAGDEAAMDELLGALAPHLA